MEISDIRERVQNPGKKAVLKDAQDQEDRIKFHTDTALTAKDAGRAATLFLNWVEGIIQAQDKFQIFKHLFRFPISTVTVTSQAFEALQKVFDGRNPVYRYSFISPEEKDDWARYRREHLREPGIWKTRGFDAMKTAINSVLIVDLPAEQEGPLPEPYFYWLPVCNVIDFTDDDGEITEIIFRQEDGSVAAFDDEFLRVFETGDGGQTIKGLRSEVRHELGYCPARFFWDTPLSFSRPAIKRSPISDTLSDLDWLLFFMVSKRHLDLYAPYPIYSGFAEDCDYECPAEDGEGQYHCDRGFLRNDSEQYVVSQAGHLRECPKCSKRRIASAGTFIEIPPPGPENDKADLRNPVQITTVDRQSLDYNVEEVDRLEARFLLAVTGYEGELLRNQALNEDQVAASFESRTNVLSGIKKNFEAAQEWVTRTICRLRYRTFEGASISYGTDFYLKTADALLDQYLKAKAEKADAMTLDTLQDQYYETKFRNNPEQLERQELIKNLDPLRHIDPVEALALYKERIISYEDFYLKTNLSSLLLRFERENGSLTEFGGTVADPAARIDKIREALLSYIVKPGEAQTPSPTNQLTDGTASQSAAA